MFRTNILVLEIIQKVILSNNYWQGPLVIMTHHKNIVNRYIGYVSQLCQLYAKLSAVAIFSYC